MHSCILKSLFYSIFKVAVIVSLLHGNANFPILLNCASTPTFSSLLENRQAYPHHLTHPFTNTSLTVVIKHRSCSDPPGSSTLAFTLFIWNWTLCAFFSKLPGTRPVCVRLAHVPSPTVEGRTGNQRCWSKNCNKYRRWFGVLSCLGKCDLKSADQHNRFKQHTETFSSWRASSQVSWAML